MNNINYRNRKTLILGDVNSGKTTRTVEILRSLVEEGEEAIAVFDFAPEKSKGVGGKMPLREEIRKKIWYASPRIVPPRMTGKTEDEAWELARENCRQIEEIFSSLPPRDWRIFVLNDISIYLQAGHVSRLLFHLASIPTAIMNGYYGRFFDESPLSRREREEMDALIPSCDQVFYLPILRSTGEK